MTLSNKPKKVTLQTREWCVPSVERAFEGWIEGKPSSGDERRMVTETMGARAAWKPSREGMLQVEQLKAFVGTRVGIQFWDSIMFMLDDEGPFPLEADCKDIVLLQDGEFMQAYLVVENTREVPTSNGYSPMGYLTTRSDVEGLLAPLADLYEIWLLPSAGKTRRSSAIAGGPAK